MPNYVSNEATGAAIATTALMPVVAGQTNFLSHFKVNGLGATVGSVITITITGLLGGTATYDYTVPTGAGVAGPLLEVTFPMALPASGPGVAISVVCPSFGAGNTIQRARVDGVSL